MSEERKAAERLALKGIGARSSWRCSFLGDSADLG